ncbi:MAG TPA: hypothetical protein VNM87_00290 [Candidatus Udaeobacter sp.]|nr:hypothetical protein [Candidatus Udaeobacter sp.]
MKRPVILALGLVLLAAIAGCQSTSHQEAQAPAEKSAEHAATETAPAQTQTAAAGAPVTLTGNVGCGHCNFGKTSECSSAIQTADGNVTVIDGVAHDSELWKLREENMKQAEVTGTMAQGPDGLQHLQMTSFKIL